MFCCHSKTKKQPSTKIILPEKPEVQNYFRLTLSSNNMYNHDNIHSSAISFHHIEFDSSSYSNSSDELSNNETHINEYVSEYNQDNTSLNQLITSQSSPNNLSTPHQISQLTQQENELIVNEEKHEKPPIAITSCDLYNLAMRVPDLSLQSKQPNQTLNRSFSYLTPKTINQNNKSIINKPSYSDSTLAINDRKSVQFNKTIRIHTIEPNSNSNPYSIKHRMIPCRKNLFGDRNHLPNKYNHEIKYTSSKIPLTYKQRIVGETRLSSPTACSEMKNLNKDNANVLR